MNNYSSPEAWRASLAPHHITDIKRSDTVLTQIEMDGRWTDYARCKASDALRRATLADGTPVRYVDWIDGVELTRELLTARVAVERGI